jgi:triphosphatase
VNSRMQPSVEIEVKLLVDRRGLQKLAALPVIGAALTHAPRQRIETIYYDTPDHLLEREGFVLRLRKGDGAPLLSVKRAAGNGIARKEWERRINGNQPQAKDWRGTPLQSLLAEKGARTPLRQLFVTVIDRAAFNCEYDGALIEAVFDRGEIKHDGRELPVSEIELELKHGDPGAVFALARELADHAPLRLGVVSKGERGRLLTSGEWGSPHAQTRPQLANDTNLREGIRIVCRTCLKDFMINESALAGGYTEEAVHQARIAVRRLRCALALFKSVLVDEELPRLKGEIGWLWDMTGPARDLDVMSAGLESRIEAGGMPQGAATLVEIVESRRDSARRALLAAIRSGRTRLLFIDLARWIEDGAWSRRDIADLGKPVMKVARRLLAKRLKKLKKRAPGIAEAKPEKQHRLRIAAKKLRLMSEFFETLVEDDTPRKRFNKLTKVLGRLQKILGRLHDDTARDHFLCEVARESETAAHVRPHIAVDAAVNALGSGDSGHSKTMKKLKKPSDKLARAKGFW